jgi:hypothetical protein
MQFEMMRLSLVRRPQADAFERHTPDGSEFTREAWLRDVFGRDIQFQHRGEPFHYSPDGTPQPRGPIVGRIGRKIIVPENKPPEAHLAPTEREAWRAAIVIIDPTHHPDGQKAAVEHLPSIGRPVAIMESLGAQVSTPSDPFILEVNAIVPSNSFWEFVDANKGQITSVQFEFVAPNMFGEADDYDSEMRDMHAQERAQRAKLKLESKDGLNLDTKRIHRAVDYTIKGAGSTEAKTKTGKKYKSKERAERILIPNKEFIGEHRESLISRLIARIFPSS